MNKSSLRVPGVRESLVPFLCVVLLIGCSGVRSDVGAGQFGPSWQAREAAYLQEEEEDDDFGERMEAADRKSKRKSAWLTVFAVVIGLGAIFADSIFDSGDEDSTFDDPLEVELTPHLSASFGVGVESGASGL